MTGAPCRRVCYASIAYGEIVLITDCPRAQTLQVERYEGLDSRRIRSMVAAFRARYIPYGIPSPRKPDYLTVNYLTPEEWRIMERSTFGNYPHPEPETGRGV